MNVEQAKAAFAAGTITAEAYIAILQGENSALMVKSVAGNELRFKVSEKGACSIYGLGRFPVTLYKGQWMRLFAHNEQLMAFIKTNSDKLAEKGTPVIVAVTPVAVAETDDDETVRLLAERDLELATRPAVAE